MVELKNEGHVPKWRGLKVYDQDVYGKFCATCKHNYSNAQRELNRFIFMVAESGKLPENFN